MDDLVDRLRSCLHTMRRGYHHEIHYGGYRPGKLTLAKWISTSEQAAEKIAELEALIEAAPHDEGYKQ